MKRIFMAVALAIAGLTAGTQQASAQGLFNKLGGLFGGKNSAVVDKIGDIASHLLGTDSLTTDRIAGTWVYSKPYVALESENVLTNIGGMAASTKLESQLEDILTKVGFTEGKLSFVLNKDNTGKFITTSDREIPFEYRLEKSDLILILPTSKKEIRINAKRTVTGLQLAVKADKLLDIIATISEKASSLGTTAQTINALVKNVKGMHIGLRFTNK